MADESGFMLQPTVRHTWAPKGQTPIHYSWDRRDRLSAISAISVSPKRRRLGLYFSIQGSNIRMDDFEALVSLLLEHFPRGVILVLDRSAHLYEAVFRGFFPARLRAWLCILNIRSPRDLEIRLKTIILKQMKALCEPILRKVSDDYHY